MKAQTKTFRRLVRKCLVKSGNISAKKARHVLSSNQQLVKSIHHGYVNHGKVWVLNAYGIKSPELQLPPSMPKSSAAKIASYEDNRESGQGIVIKLKPGFTFNDSWGDVPMVVNNVKEAITIMRTVVAV